MSSGHQNSPYQDLVELEAFQSLRQSIESDLINMENTQSMALPTTLGSELGQISYQPSQYQGSVCPSFDPNFATPPASTIHQASSFFQEENPTIPHSTVSEIPPSHIGHTSPLSRLRGTRDSMIPQSFQGMCNVVSAIAGQAIGYGAVTALTPICGTPLATMAGNVLGGVVTQNVNDKICTQFSSQPMVSNQDPVVLPGVHGPVICTISQPQYQSQTIPYSSPPYVATGWNTQLVATQGLVWTGNSQAQTMSLPVQAMAPALSSPTVFDTRSGQLLNREDQMVLDRNACRPGNRINMLTPPHNNLQPARQQGPMPVQVSQHPSIPHAPEVEVITHQLDSTSVCSDTSAMQLQLIQTQQMLQQAALINQQLSERLADKENHNHILSCLVQQHRLPMQTQPLVTQPTYPQTQSGLASQPPLLHNTEERPPSPWGEPLFIPQAGSIVSVEKAPSRENNPKPTGHSAPASIISPSVVNQLAVQISQLLRQPNPESIPLLAPQGACLPTQPTSIHPVDQPTPVLLSYQRSVMEARDRQIQNHQYHQVPSQSSLCCAEWLEDHPATQPQEMGVSADCLSWVQNDASIIHDHPVHKSSSRGPSTHVSHAAFARVNGVLRPVESIVRASSRIPTLPVTAVEPICPSAEPPRVVLPSPPTPVVTQPPIGYPPIPEEVPVPLVGTVDRDPPLYLQQLTEAVLNMSRNHQSGSHQRDLGVDRTDKFKVVYNMTLRGTSISKGQRVTSAYVIKILGIAKDIDIQAIKASSRLPTTPTEWAMFFKFHLAHFQGALHEEMTTLVHANTYTDIQAFWDAVFQLVFPPYIAREAFAKALTSYMIWDEPMGIDRWRTITHTLVTHMAYMGGKRNVDLDLYVAEHMYQQLQRVVDSCPETNSLQLGRDFAPYNQAIEMAMNQGLVITTLLYTQAFEGFYGFIKRWLDRHTYVLIFGKEQAGTTPTTNTKSTPSTQNQIRNIQAYQCTIHSKPDPVETGSVQTESAPSSAPSYTQVVQEGGQGLQGHDARPPAHKPKLHNSAAAKAQRRTPSKLAKVAPTGKTRTWWESCTTYNADSTLRQPCMGAPPPECNNPQCEYLGDWLDYKGICVYCLEPGHIRSDCPLLAINKTKYLEHQARQHQKQSGNA